LGSAHDENEKAELADKPGSVVDSHSSTRCVTAVLQQPTRTFNAGPYLVLLQVGFAVPVRYRTRGALLPHHFTLTGSCERRRYLSVALSVGSRRPGVTWHLALWSPDFPRHSFNTTTCIQAMTRLSGQLYRCRLLHIFQVS